MFGSAIEALFVRAPVGIVHLMMKFPVRAVITSVSTIVVMGQCRCGRCTYGQHRRSNESSANGHDTSPIQTAPGPSAEPLHSQLQYGGEVEPHRNTPFRSRSWHAAKVELPRCCRRDRSKGVCVAVLG